MAYRRRSPALALIAIGFAAQWVPWARIDRAAFQYHYYTALPFVILALAYLVAELWHGASRRTWMWVRIAGGGGDHRTGRDVAVVPAALRARRRDDRQPGFAGVSGRHPGLRPDGPDAGRSSASSSPRGIVLWLWLTRRADAGT